MGDAATSEAEAVDTGKAAILIAALTHPDDAKAVAHICPDSCWELKLTASLMIYGEQHTYFAELTESGPFYRCTWAAKSIRMKNSPISTKS